jgi:hypothetical protein
VEERDGEAVVGPDRDGPPACRNAAREADRARGRRANEGARRRADVDAAVLPAGVRVVTENEWT